MATSYLPAVRLAGLACAVPANAKTNQDFEQAFGPDAVASVSKFIGVSSRRVVDATTCASDLCEAAANVLLDDLGWERDSVDALIFVTQTPDYVLPPSSTTLQTRLGLSRRVAAFDINLGCSGYVYGLWVAAGLISAGACARALVLVGDTSTRFLSPYDRSTVLLFGDAGSASALERDPGSPGGHFALGTDGAGARSLIIHAGAFRTPSSPKTRRRIAREDGTVRSDEDLAMNGAEVSNFTLETVCPLVKELLAAAGMDAESVDYFVFHQANQFILKHIARKLAVQAEKVPISMERFGNTSSASIPITLVSELRERLTSATADVVMAGFGVGYSWAAAAMRMGPLASLKLVEV